MYFRGTGIGLDTFTEYNTGYEPMSFGEAEWADIRATLAPRPWEYFLDDETDKAFLKQQLKEQYDRMLELYTGPQGVAGYGFFYWARLPWRAPVQKRVSVVSFAWPTEYLESRGIERLHTEIMALAALLPYSSGHAGLAFASPNWGGAYMGDIYEEALRYPGLDANHGDWELGTHVDGVHWLNFLGPDLLARMGGADALRAQLHAPSTTVRDLKGGRAVVSLGPVPEAGDLSRGDTLPAYRELAQVFRPWLLPCHPNRTWRDCPPDTARRWWHRFLD